MLRCDKCGLVFGPGQLRYGVAIELTSLFDGYIPEPEGDVEEELARVLETLRKQDPAEAAKDVAQSISLVLCRPCRNRFVRDWDVAGPATRH